jgi:flavin reductase (DIM6/NTAB) family NADH-FMN oxidoreductase RutF
MAAGQLTALEFREALGQFATGVAVVTVERSPNQVHGMTANSFTSVSLDPLLILVCVENRARLLPLLQEKKKFGVNVLKDGQRALSEFFARPDPDPEEEVRLGIRYRWTPDGVPLLEDTLCHLVCSLIETHPAGDHTICVAEVDFAQIHSGEPLLFFRGQYRRIARHS